MHVTNQGNGKFTVENLDSNKSYEVEVNDLEFEKNALIWMTINDQKKCFQLHDIHEDISFKFYYKGFPLVVNVYDSVQEPLVQYMPPPKVVDHAKMIMS